MLTQLTRNWWVVVLRGVVAILYGLTALLLPLATLQILVLFFGAYAIVDGIIAIIAAVTNRAGHDRWWLLLLEGLLGIGAGVIVLLRPGLATLVLLAVIGAWAMVTGILEIIAAIQLRKEIHGEWLLALGGLASIVFGVLVWLFPTAGAVTIAWLIGWYALIYGGSLVGLGLRLRKHGDHFQNIKHMSLTS